MDAFYASVELLRYPSSRVCRWSLAVGAGTILTRLALHQRDLDNTDPTESAPPWDAEAQRAALKRIPLEALRAWPATPGAASSPPPPMPRASSASDRPWAS